MGDIRPVSNGSRIVASLAIDSAAQDEKKTGHSLFSHCVCWRLGHSGFLLPKKDLHPEGQQVVCKFDCEKHHHIPA
jgi:hypothetical protein